MDPIPQPASSLPATPDRPRGATFARWSWLLVVIGIVVNGLVKRAFGAFAADLVVLALIVTGLALAILALARVRREGRAGILLPAIVGLVLNGLLVLIFVTNFFAYRARQG